MGQISPKIGGPEYAALLFRQMEKMAQDSITRSGDIDVDPIAAALTNALQIPECREAVILLTARYVACCMTGCIPDLP